MATPALTPPAGLSVTLADRKKQLVRVAWSLPKWVSAVEILRDGAPFVRTTSPATTTYDDIPPLWGTHTYAVRTLYTAGPSKTLFRSDATAALTLRTAPFRMVAMGDSIMWGQGLADSAKFTSLTRDAIRANLGVDVELTSFAHSGAILREPTAPLVLPAVGQPEITPFNQALLTTSGEVPNSYSTILHQINVQAPSTTSLVRSEVDLVLVDGCINDVGVQNVLNPLTATAAVQATTETKCKAMEGVLNRAHAVFPNAAIVVTGYYPIVSALTDLSLIPPLVATVVGPAALAVAPALSLPPDPVLAVAAIAGALHLTEAKRQNLIANSLALYNTSNSVLAAAAQSASAQAGSASLITFAKVPFEPKNAYGAPARWLWLIPTGLVPNDQDDVIAERGTKCHQAGALDRSVGSPLVPGATAATGVDMLKCERASMGHPNRAGAQAYAAAIATALQGHMPGWRTRYATTRSAGP